MTRYENSQEEIDKENANFWNTLCGSQLAKELGISDDSSESLRKFDDWYFKFYPYLNTHIPFAKLNKKRVLEVGLGYGTVSQKIAESGADYTGLDIAIGPVHMVNLRLKRGDFIGRAVQGSILESSFEDNYFDWAIAIGCLHHTGNLKEAIHQVYRVLKPGGQAMIMVYSALSYRQFQDDTLGTIKRLFAKPKIVSEIGKTSGDKKSRGAYDTNTDGTAAPQTEFVTKDELKLMCRSFSSCSVTSENIGQDGIFRTFSRDKVLQFGKYVGLDLYCRLKK